ncbi:MAG: hypothetical protein GWO12_07930, partial [Gemmatimonadetes bacterium]|nr:hypothetical protein [Candidatus Kutchimonas denitrificans]
WRWPAHRLVVGPGAKVEPADVESDATALRAWSRAAGELRSDGSGPQKAAPLDPEEVPK